MAGIRSAYFTDFSSKTATGARADNISKNSWMDIYADLYRQCFGEAVSAEEIVDDAERRLAILKVNGLR